MAESNPPVNMSPFPPGYRAAGVLLHITSLPSPYGIGDLGPGAFEWVDRLNEAGQSWWQALPLGPTGYCNSPYLSLSSFVGNWLLISPDLLIEDGLLRADDCEKVFSSASVDYQLVIPSKRHWLDMASVAFQSGVRKDLRRAYEEFCQSRANWLEDYALFRALKAKYNNVPYLEWPEELVRRAPSALAEARRTLALEIDKVRFAQFLLFRQANTLKQYARAKGVRLIGDLPFFVSPDSSDVWANPELFLLDDCYRPRFVGGVPPDYFTERGQLWGNPVYDWEALRRAGYSWCIDRIVALQAHVDVIRLDHFRGFAAAWHIPADAPTAKTGEWVPGPGADFFRAVHRKLGSLPFTAEDLGLITPDVFALRDEFQIPGTRVLQFAFDGNPDNPHLPCNYPERSVVYTGTHDNATTREWYTELPDRERQCLGSYVGKPVGPCDAAAELIRLAWSSPAAVAITPLQDLLNLGSEARMNVPGRPVDNWRWRVPRRMLSHSGFKWLKDLTTSSNRWRPVQAPSVQVAS